MKGNEHLFEIKTKKKEVIWEALIQAETPIEFLLGGKGKAYL